MATLTTSWQKVGEWYVGNTGYANVYLRSYMKYSEQDIANNRSYVYHQTRLYVAAGSFYAGTTTTKGISIDGIGENYNVNATGTYNAGETTLLNAEGWLYHATDGSRSMYGVAAFYSSPWGWNVAQGATAALPKIPRYATSNQSFNSKTETTIKMNWSSDSTIDYIWYSKDNGSNWTAVGSVNASSGNYTISGLSANTAYNIKTRVRRKDSQLTTDSSATSVTTYQYPYVSAVGTSALSIGSKQTLTLYNPLSRTVDVYMKQTNTSGTQLYKGSTSGTSFSFTPTASTLYASIPNDTSGNAVYYCIYSSQNVGTKSGTYTIVANDCKPTFTNFEYSTNLSNLTGDTTTIINGETTTTFTVPLKDRAVAKNSATMKKYRIECGGNTNEMSYSSNADVSGTISGCTNQNLKVVAIDSRGLETSISINANKFIAYSRPSFASTSTERKDGVEAETHLNFEANYWNGNFGNGNNSIVSLEYRVKPSSSSTWSGWYDKASDLNKITYSGGKASLMDYLIHSNGISGGFTIGTAYDVQIRIKDGLSNNALTTIPSSTISITDGLVGISMTKDSNGNYRIGINGMPDNNNSLNINGNAKATKFIGNLEGNATSATTATTASSCSGNSATATKATQDGSGNVITSTYEKKSTKGSGYIKFDNGIMICWGTVSGTTTMNDYWSTLNRTQSLTGKFAQTFNANPTVTLTVSGSTAVGIQMTGISTTAVTCYMFKPRSTSDTAYKFTYTAIGTYK